MMKKTFCEECRNDVEYTTVSFPMTGTIKGKEYHYTGIETCCADCGNLVFFRRFRTITCVHFTVCFEKRIPLLRLCKTIRDYTQMVISFSINGIIWY